MGLGGYECRLIKNKACPIGGRPNFRDGPSPDRSHSPPINFKEGPTCRSDIMSSDSEEEEEEDAAADDDEQSLVEQLSTDCSELSTSSIRSNSSSNGVRPNFKEEQPPPRAEQLSTDCSELSTSSIRSNSRSREGIINFQEGRSSHSVPESGEAGWGETFWRYMPVAGGVVLLLLLLWP